MCEESDWHHHKNYYSWEGDKYFLQRKKRWSRHTKSRCPWSLYEKVLTLVDHFFLDHSLSCFVPNHWEAVIAGMFFRLRRWNWLVPVWERLGFKSGIHILNRYFKATTGKNAAMEEAYPSSSKPSKSRSLLLHNHKCSQETQSTSRPFSALIHQLSHYPHAETKQNLITHVAHLLAMLHSQKLSVTCWQTDW